MVQLMVVPNKKGVVAYKEISLPDKHAYASPCIPPNI